MKESKIQEYSVNDATHVLVCRHCVGHNKCLDYTMKAIKLGITKSNKIKIIVFGDRYWKYREHIKKIRYVSCGRLHPIQKQLF